MITAAQISFQIHNQRALGELCLSIPQFLLCTEFTVNVSTLCLPWLTQRQSPTPPYALTHSSRVFAGQQDISKVIKSKPNSQMPKLWTDTCICSPFLNGAAIKKSYLKPGFFVIKGQLVGLCTKKGPHTHKCIIRKKQCFGEVHLPASVQRALELARLKHLAMTVPWDPPHMMWKNFYEQNWAFPSPS